jgi:ubiquinone/menaquinone biosynthesis C-methylase UbiE
VATDVQRDAYESADSVFSDALDLIPRDNRNHRKKQSVILNETTADAGDKVLEVGCGDGLHAERYADVFDYWGVDLSPSLVDATQRRVESEGVVLEMNAMDLAFPDNEFDAVVGTAILHHLDDPAAALREWQRVTTAGGSITLMEPNYLFPKDFVATHMVPEERHKRNMHPVRLDGLLSGVSERYEITPITYTPPWPSILESVYDQIDSVMQSVPGVRWLSQMLLLRIRV